MQTVNEFPAKIGMQANQAVVAPAHTSQRLDYIDTLRVILIVLVVMVHAAVTYGALGGWMYEEPVQDEITSILLSIFTIICQSFFMGLFFFISGYFIPGSVDRKGLTWFWKDRLLRLAVPFLFFTLILSKVPIYIDEVANHGLTLSFSELFVDYFWKAVDAGPTWFLFVLLIFGAGYSLWRIVTRWIPGRPAQTRLQPRKAPGTWALLGFGLVMAVGTFVVCQWNPLANGYDLFDGVITFLVTFLPQYVLMFIAGILAYRNDWLRRLPGNTLRFWGWLSAGLIVFLPIFLIGGGATSGRLDTFFTGLNWRAAGMNLWVGLMCVSCSMTLILWLRSRIQSQSRLMAFASPLSFAVYIIHPVVLVAITYGLSFLLFPPAIKYILASILTVSAAFLLSAGLRRLPGVRAVL